MIPNALLFNPTLSGLLDGGVVAVPGLWPGKMTARPFRPSAKVRVAINRMDLRSRPQNLPPGSFRSRNVVAEFEKLMATAVHSAGQGSAARCQGDEAGAEAGFREALRLVLKGNKRAGHHLAPAGRRQMLFTAARFALEGGEVMEARRLIREASSMVPLTGLTDDMAELRDISRWKDAWLIAAVRQPNPDAAALDILGDRYWKTLFGRCHLLTLNHEKARDLAQETWCRVLRTRMRLKPGGNFSAYLATIATNLWRDWYRISRRAGGLAENRLESLDAAFTHDDGGQSEPMVDRVPDPKNLAPADRSLLALDIDAGLRNLAPQQREVLLARYIVGESCAEIAGRYGCTEQTVSGWIRQALRKMKRHLDFSSEGVAEYHGMIRQKMIRS